MHVITCSSLCTLTGVHIGAAVTSFSGYIYTHLSTCYTIIHIMFIGHSNNIICMINCVLYFRFSTIAQLVQHRPRNLAVVGSNLIQCFLKHCLLGCITLPCFLISCIYTFRYKYTHVQSLLCDLTAPLICHVRVVSNDYRREYDLRQDFSQFVTEFVYILCYPLVPREGWEGWEGWEGGREGWEGWEGERDGREGGMGGMGGREGGMGGREGWEGGRDGREGRDGRDGREGGMGGMGGMGGREGGREGWEGWEGWEGRREGGREGGNL